MIKIIDCGFSEFIERCKRKKLYCFGAGKQFERFMQYASELHIDAIIDNNIDKQNTVKKIGEKEIKIISLTSFIEMNIQDYSIVITTASFNEVINDLDTYKEFSNIDCYIFMFLRCFTESTSKVIKYPKQPQIPKKIHYCWLGSSILPKEFVRNIDSWKEMCPDYEIVRWDETNIDIEDNLYIKQAYEKEAWAFVSDVVRVKALYEEGGIYLDTDVQLIKNLDPLLGWDFFCGYEDRQHVAFGLGYGAVRRHPILKRLLELYNQLSYVDMYGNINKTPCPYYQTQILQQFGFRLDGNFEEKDGAAIFPKEFFSPFNYCKGLGKITEQTYSIHWYSASWKSSSEILEKKKMEEEIQKVYRHIDLQDNS